jgi:hypothetical protein
MKEILERELLTEKFNPTVEFISFGDYNCTAYRHAWLNKYDELNSYNDKPSAFYIIDNEIIWICYHKNGIEHRDNNKPAVIEGNGYKRYFKNGIQYVPENKKQ